MQGKELYLRLLLAGLLAGTAKIEPHYEYEQPMLTEVAAQQLRRRPAKRRDTKAAAKPRKKQKLGRRDTRRRRG